MEQRGIQNFSVFEVYEEGCCPMEYDAVQSGRNLPVFQGSQLLPASE
jgi:hypothetical protein